MSHKRSQLQLNSAGACLAVALAFMLTWRLAPSVHAQTASGQSDPQTRLVVLRNQPARQVVDSLESKSGTPRKLAEQDLDRLHAQAGVPEQMKLDAGRRLLTQLLAERREATEQIKAAIEPEQQMLAGRLTGLGATGIRRYTALNMLQARIPDAMLDVVKQDSAVAEVIPVGAHQDLLDQIEQGLSDPQELSVTLLDKADSSDPAEQAFAKLIDRIVYDRNALVAAVSDAAAFNTVPAVYSLAKLARSGALPVAHQEIKALVLNGGKSRVFGNSVSAGKSFRLYTGRSEGPLQSTLTWDRRFDEGLNPYLPNLDLFLYDKGQGAQLASSESQDKNVELVALSDAGEFVVKVKLQPSDGGGAAEESYSLAVSGRAFTPAEGPKLSVKCAANCIVGNDGDLPAYNVTASVQGQDYNLGTIQPSAHATFSPASKTSTPVATVVSQSFGETFAASSGSWTISGLSNIDAAGDPITVTVTPPTDAYPWLASVTAPFGVSPSTPMTGTRTITLSALPNINSSPQVGTLYLIYPTTLIPGTWFTVTQGYIKDPPKTFNADGEVKPPPQEGVALDTVTVELYTDPTSSITAKVDPKTGKWQATGLLVGKTYQAVVVLHQADSNNYDTLPLSIDDVTVTNATNLNFRILKKPHGLTVEGKPVKADSPIYLGLATDLGKVDPNLGKYAMVVMDAMIASPYSHSYATKQSFINDVAFRAYHIRAARDLDKQRDGFNPTATCQGCKHWYGKKFLALDPNTQQQVEVTGLMSKKPPSLAMLEIFDPKKPSMFEFECATAQVIAYDKALLDYMGAKDFDLLFSAGIQLHSLVWPGIYPPMKPWEALPGDGVAFRNPDSTNQAAKNENALFLGGDEYYGHDLGVLTKERMLDVLKSSVKPGGQAPYPFDTGLKVWDVPKIPPYQLKH